MGLSSNMTNRNPGAFSTPGIEFAPVVYDDPSGLRVVSLCIGGGGYMMPLLVYISS